LHALGQASGAELAATLDSEGTISKIAFQRYFHAHLPEGRQEFDATMEQFMLVAMQAGRGKRPLGEPESSPPTPEQRSTPERLGGQHAGLGLGAEGDAAGRDHAGGGSPLDQADMQIEAARQTLRRSLEASSLRSSGLVSLGPPQLPLDAHTPLPRRDATMPVTPGSVQSALSSIDEEEDPAVLRRLLYAQSRQCVQQTRELVELREELQATKALQSSDGEADPLSDEAGPATQVMHRWADSTGVELQALPGRPVPSEAGGWSSSEAQADQRLMVLVLGDMEQEILRLQNEL